MVSCFVVRLFRLIVKKPVKSEPARAGKTFSSCPPMRFTLFYLQVLVQAQGSSPPGYGGLSITFSTCLLPFSMFCGGKNPRVKYEKMW